MEDSDEPEMAGLPESWRTLESGAPALNWVAAVDEARRDLGIEPADATVGLRGMFSDFALGVSLADELIADRPAEVRAEEDEQRSGNDISRETP